jgi:hypothetical protein
MKASLLLLFLVGWSYLYSAAQDESCPALAKSESRKFPEERDAVRISPCIPAMITRLGEARDKESVHLLARYLDYMDPATSPRLDGGLLSAEQLKSLDGASRIELGFPQSIYEREMVRSIRYGGTWDRLLL